MFAPRQTLAVSRNGSTQDISNHEVCFVVEDNLKPGVDSTENHAASWNNARRRIVEPDCRKSSVRRRSVRRQYRDIWCRCPNWRLRNCS